MSAGFEALAVLLRYPRHDYRLALETALSGSGGASEDLARLATELEPLTDTELEELYTRTFDLNPVAALEIGWQLWGEAYERGRFLAEMRARLARAELEEAGELPDHLSNVLRLLDHLEPDAAAALALDSVAPAVAKMIDAFSGSDNPYRFLIRAVAAALRDRFPLPATAAAAEAPPRR